MAVRPFLILALSATFALAQTTPNEAEQPVRVNVTVNPDGTRTAYQFDPAHRQATATTMNPDGSVTGKIKYNIDEAGRFGSGLVYGPNDKFLFKTTYKYTPQGRLDEETRLTRDDHVINKLVYSYDTNGRQTGYVVLDASGKVLGQTSPVSSKPTSTEKPHKKK